MKVLVTGAGGFVGGYVVRQLLSRRHEVFSLGTESGALADWGVTTYKADILDIPATDACIKEIVPDAVIHLAAVSHVPSSWDKPALTAAVNVEGTLHILQSLHKTNPAAKLLSVGSGDEYGWAAKSGRPLTEDTPCQPQNPYAISKYCAGQMVLQMGKKYGMTVIHTRSFNHFGPGQAKGFVVSDFASQIAEIERGGRDSVLYVGDLDVYRDFTYVEDVAAAYVALLENDVPGGVYNVCSGTARSVRDILDELLTLSNVRIRVTQAADRFRISDVPYFVGDAGKLRRAVAWEPVHGFEEGLEKVLEDWRSLMHA